MICQPCRKGADVIDEHRRYGHGSRSATLAVAQAYHALCKGRTHCDCQHEIDRQVAGESIEGKS